MGLRSNVVKCEANSFRLVLMHSSDPRMILYQRGDNFRNERNVTKRSAKTHRSSPLIMDEFIGPALANN